jgi:hypothetical protein
MNVGPPGLAPAFPRHDQSSVSADNRWPPPAPKHPGSLAMSESGSILQDIDGHPGEVKLPAARVLSGFAATQASRGVADPLERPRAAR